MAFEDTKDYGSVYGRGRVLLRNESASMAEAEVMCFYFKWILLERMGSAQ